MTTEDVSRSALTSLVATAVPADLGSLQMEAPVVVCQTDMIRPWSTPV